MKLSTLFFVKALGIVAALALVYWLAGAVFSGKDPPPAPFKLFAASHVDGGKAEVRLRWMMTKGWLPKEGVNLYRSEPGGKEILLNPVVLGANRGSLKNSPWTVPAKPTAKQGTTKVKWDYDYQAALAHVQKHQDKLSQVVFSPVKLKRLPSADSAKAFLALQQLRLLHFNPKEVDPLAKPKAPVSMARPDLVDHPALLDYYEKLGFEQKVQAAPKKKLQKPTEESPEAAAAKLRTDLVLGAMLHPDTIGNDLGLAFNDQKVEAGKTYHYVLKVVENGEQTKVAECDVVVQNGPALKPPTGLQGFQYDATTVCLRWNRIEPSDSLGLVSYDLYRTDNNNPASRKKLNRMPIIIHDLPIVRTTRIELGTHMEPMVLYHDTTAGSMAPGEVKYEIVAVDMFGRSSAASTGATVKLDDLVAPPPVSVVAAELSKKERKVQVIWTAVEQPDVMYNVHRIDTETRGWNWKKETATLLARTSGDANPNVADYPELASTVKRSEMRGKPGPDNTDPPKKPVWLGFTDSPPEDHHFIYKVTAVYKTHPRPSPAQLTKEIPVPSPKAPAAPIVQGSFIPVAAAKVQDPGKVDLKDKKVLKPEDLKPEVKIQPIDKSKSPELTAEFKPDMLRLVNIDSNPLKPADFAGVVHLKWNAVPMAHAYRIYRASGTGFRPSTTDTVADPKDPIGRFRYHAEIPDTELKEAHFSLVGQVVGKAEFYDNVSRSPAHIYWYRVVAVSRWGVPTAKATSQTWSKAVKVRVPGTVPPATPILIAAAADQDGNIQLTLAAPAPTDAAVNYHVYRGQTALTADPSPSIKGHKQIPTEKGLRKGDTVVIVDKVVQSQFTYEYYVIADNGETPPVFSPASIKLRASTFKALVIAPTDVQAFKKADGIHVQWKGVANAAGYIVERSHGGPKGEFAQISDLLKKDQTSFPDRTPGPGPTYTYRVIAVDNAEFPNVSNPNAYPLDSNTKDPSKYPGWVTITVK